MNQQQQDHKRAMLLLIKKEMHNPDQKHVLTPSQHRPAEIPDAPVKKRKFQPLRHLCGRRNVSKLVLAPIAKKKTVRWASPVKQEQFANSVFAAAPDVEEEEVFIEEDGEVFIKQEDEVVSLFDVPEYVDPIVETDTVITKVKPREESVTQAVSHTELKVEEIVVDAIRRKLCGLLQGHGAVKRYELLVGIKETHALELKAMKASHPYDLRSKVDVDGTGIEMSLAKYADLYARIGVEIDMLKTAAFFASSKVESSQGPWTYPKVNMARYEQFPASHRKKEGEARTVAEIVCLVVKIRQGNIAEARCKIWQQMNAVRNKDMKLYGDVCKLVFDWSKGVESIELAATLARQLKHAGPDCLRGILETHMTKLQSTEFFAKYASSSTALQEERADFNDLRLVLRQLLVVVRQIEGLGDVDEYDMDEDSIDLAESEKEDEKRGFNL